MSNALHVRQIWTERLQNTKVALISKQYRGKKKAKKKRYFPALVGPAYDWNSEFCRTFQDHSLFPDFLVWV